MSLIDTSTYFHLHLNLNLPLNLNLINNKFITLLARGAATNEKLIHMFQMVLYLCKVWIVRKPGSTQVYYRYQNCPIPNRKCGSGWWRGSDCCVVIGWVVLIVLIVVDCVDCCWFNEDTKHKGARATCRTDRLRITILPTHVNHHFTFIK